jgi:hypothetical protein
MSLALLSFSFGLNNLGLDFIGDLAKGIIAILIGL